MDHEGKIFAKLDSISIAIARLEVAQKNLETGQGIIANLVDSVRTGNCPMGVAHDKRIEKLEARPERALANLSAVSAILATIAAFIAWLHGR